MKDSLSLRFLYNTLPGRAVLSVLVRPGISNLAGRFLDSRLSKLFIPYFKKSNGITLDNIITEDGFDSFNSFFARRRKVISYSKNPDDLISPCDSFLSAYTVDGDLMLDIKHSIYTVPELLESEELAERYRGGYCLIFRLTPAHYHRYHFVDDGEIRETKTIKGIMHCVRPIALREYPVFTQNSREYVVFDSKHFGTLIQMEVGALFVGRITNHSKKEVNKAEEKGYFEFGGSTIVLFISKDSANLNEEIISSLNSGREIPVTLGDVIATAKK